MKIENAEEFIKGATGLFEEAKPFLELLNNEVVIELIKTNIKSYLGAPANEIDAAIDAMNKYFTKKIATSRKLMFEQLQIPLDAENISTSFTREEAFALILKDASQSDGKFTKQFGENLIKNTDLSSKTNTNGEMF